MQSYFQRVLQPEVGPAARADRIAEPDAAALLLLAAAGRGRRGGDHAAVGSVQDQLHGLPRQDQRGAISSQLGVHAGLLEQDGGLNGRAEDHCARNVPGTVLVLIHLMAICMILKLLQMIFRNVWADHADLLSVQYAGTGALKTDFTRTGRRTAAGMASDLANSAVRYYKNNFADGFRQDAIDLFLGNYRVEDNPGI